MREKDLKTINTIINSNIKGLPTNICKALNPCANEAVYLAKDNAAISMYEAITEELNKHKNQLLAAADTFQINFEYKGKLKLGSDFKKSQGRRGCTIYTFKPDKKYAGYVPKVVVMYYPTSLYPRVRYEASAPKLVFGTSFFGLENGYFYTLFESISLSLLELADMDVDFETIANAICEKIHYAINIFLPPWATCLSVILEILKASLSRQKGGFYISEDGKWCYKGNKTSGTKFYDKKDELKRAAKKDRSLIPLLSKLGNRHLLRIETYLNTKKAITTFLPKIGILNSSLTFRELYDGDMAKKSLQYRLNEILDNIPPTYNLDWKQMFYAIEMENKNPQKRSLIRDVKVHEQEGLNHKQIINLLSPTFKSDKAARVFVNAAKKVKVNANATKHAAFDIIIQALNEFKALTPYNIDEFSDNVADKESKE